MKKVSIIIRTKNEERWILSCIEKIYSQSYKNIEVIIVDNYSKDKTIEKIKKYPVKILKIKKFLPGKAINLGIKKSSGDIIVCLSAHCLPVKNTWLNNLIRPLKNKKIAGVYGRQQPMSYSSVLDKRDLITIFGLDKKVQINDPFFHNANSAFEKIYGKKYLLIIKLLILRIGSGAKKLYLKVIKLFMSLKQVFFIGMEYIKI